MSDESPKPHIIDGPGVGMPAALKLDEFASHVWAAFGDCPYLVGSALINKRGWRDVDVRVLLPDEEYEAMRLGKPEQEHNNDKWIALVLAFSALGREMTGLPIDFQIQQRTYANTRHPGPRSALGMVPLRFMDPDHIRLRDAVGRVEALADALEADDPDGATAIRAALIATARRGLAAGGENA